MGLNDVKKISGRVIFLEGNVPGQAAYIESVSAETLPPGSEAYARNDGSTQNVILVFGIPQGEQGEQGETGNGIESITLLQTVGLVKTYRILFTDGDHFDFNVTDGKGIDHIEKTGSVGLVDTYTIYMDDGVTTATFSVTNGADGAAATVAVGSTTTGDPGTDAEVTNSGDEHNAVLNFKIPKGATGATGNGIASIELLTTVGLVKTYRITMTSGAHFDYNVEDGNGIASVELISTVGATKTYRILFTDGTNFDFEVVDGSDEWGAIVGNLSDQTDLQNALDAKAPVITESASGSIVTISDGADGMPVSALSVGIEPVQDLHGYDNPWPGGSNLNLIPDGTDTEKGYVANKYLSGTGVQFTTDNYYISEYFPVEASAEYGWKKFGNQSSNAPAICFYDSNKSFISGETYNYRTSFTIETPSTAAYARVSVFAEATNTKCIFVKGSTLPDSWTPYSNICPISGWSQAKVTRTGKNLFNVNSLGSNRGLATSINSNGSITVSGQATASYSDLGVTYPLSIKAGQTVTLSVSKTLSFRIITRLFYSDNTYVNVGIQKDSTTIAVTETLQKDVVGCRIYISDITSGTSYSETFFAQLEIGSSASSFEPYQGTSVTIDLNGTRYGGNIDVLTGTMTVTKAIIDLGTLTWDMGTAGEAHQRYKSTDIKTLVKSPSSGTDLIDMYCTIYKPATANQLYSHTYNCSIGFDTSGNLFVWDSAYINTSSANFQTAMSGVKLVYPLATPDTVPLTSAQLSTLLGQNNIWADTGDVTVTYRADTKMYIDNAVADANEKTRQMITTVTDQMIAPKNLTSGDLVIVNDDLYKATANIASGATLTVGTNVTKITLAEYIQSLL